jgi:ABC-2 type transport system permease protein
MTILYNRAYGGYFMVRELHLGVIDRFLVTPISRAALICGQLINGTLVSVVQVVILLVLARIQGAEYPGGIAGLLILVLASMMLGIAVGAASQGFALVSRQEDTIIAVISCVILPLTFLSSTLMATSLMPGWLRDIAHYNPVNWAVEAGRSALSASPDWSLIGWRFGALFVVMIACLWLATRGFRSYQKSI